MKCWMISWLRPSNRSASVSFLRAVEDIGLFDLDPGEFTPLRVQLVAQPGELLLLRQMYLAGCQPLVSRHDPIVSHLSISPSTGFPPNTRRGAATCSSSRVGGHLGFRLSRRPP